MQTVDFLVLVLKASNIPDVRISIVVKIMMNFFVMSPGFVPGFPGVVMVLTRHKLNMLQQI